MWVHRSRVETWKRRNSVSFLSTRTKRFRLPFRPIPFRKKSETILVSRRVSCQDNRIPRVTTRVLPPFDPFPRSVAWNFARQGSTSGIRKRNFHLRSGVFHSRQIFTDFSSWSFHDRWSRNSDSNNRRPTIILPLFLILYVEILIFGKQYCPFYCKCMSRLIFRIGKKMDSNECIKYV